MTTVESKESDMRLSYQKRNRKIFKSMRGQNVKTIQFALSQTDSKSIVDLGKEKSSMTSRKKFLEMCYETQDRFLEFINSPIKHRTVLNKELTEICNAIKSINKADLYERVIKDHLPEADWPKFLNDVYSKPFEW
eukprot:CAMPEP_0168336744 /NCGR_PEP_ID=MMETSP0213-20121227/11746_1 /TAXON_ID=151035 /ORGANISM="Euplotes harpa, Strain FSP1.4" /LENGTH=134 /DNA_ID=CAMNT_0008342039 /DNA_START=1206 /DNA_END=1607 /DNA_ORIENTATION=+